MTTTAVDRPTFPAQTARDVVARALAEDRAGDDVTTRWVVPKGARVAGHILTREAGTVAGLALVGEVYRQLDERVRVFPLTADGDRVAPGQRLLSVAGPARSVVTGERVALNLLQRMCGIATGAAAFVAAVADLPTTILDTRKTAPGLRLLDKYAVACGGATNHRHDLSAMVLVKENHLAAAGGVTAAVRAIRAGQTHDGRQIQIEIEASTHTEAVEAMEQGVDRVLLDNMTPDQIRVIVSLRDERPAYAGVRLEASGNVTRENVREVALAGVDAISVGALTHSVTALDLSMLVDVA